MEILSHESLFSIRNKLSEIEVGIIQSDKEYDFNRYFKKSDGLYFKE